jgi:hypothetical protein
MVCVGLTFSQMAVCFAERELSIDWTRHGILLPAPTIGSSIFAAFLQPPEPIFSFATIDSEAVASIPKVLRRFSNVTILTLP